MFKTRTICLLIIILMYCMNVISQDVKNNSDTIFIRSFNKDSNSVQSFELFYIKNNVESSIIQINNTDYSVEFEYVCDFYNSANSIKVYTIYDLAKGFDMNIFFDIVNKIFYNSDWYNGSEEIILYHTIDFVKYEFKTVRIASPDCGKNNILKIYKLYPK